MNIRNKIFWIVEFLKGNEIKSHARDIKYNFYNYNDEKATLNRNAKLKHIVDHCFQTVPYYKDKIVQTKFENLPIVNKSIIKSNFIEFQSIRINKKKRYPVTTSGSTGTPFTVYRNKIKLNRHKADNIFFSKLANFELGSSLFYFRVWNKINKKSKILSYFQNIRMIEIGNLSDKKIREILEEINNSKKNLSILSFSSALNSLAAFLSKHLADYKFLNVDSIIGMSENLPQKARIKLKEVFNCDVVSRYSNMENGFIAQQIKDSEAYFINHGSYLVEVFDLDNDELLPYGSLGRIVVTDYYNKQMPLVRYDTGDMGILDLVAGFESFGPTLTDISGRKVDSIFNVLGELISPHVITNTMWNYSYINQFQFIQETEDVYRMKINSDAPFTDSDDLIKLLKKYLGDSSKVIIEEVNEIPLLSSGKRKKIVNLMNK